MNASIAQVAPQQTLIPVFQAEIGGLLTNACDARTLHKFLEVTTRFNDWILRRIKYYGFVENQDYVTVLKNEYSENQGFQTIDYTLTLDTGKELSMVEKNEKGRQARKYFIECERIAIESMIAKSKTQYGLKHLPPSPYITEAEAQQFKKSMEEHCKGNGKGYSMLYRKVYDYFNITSYKHIPTGKLAEAARLIGVKLVAVKKPKLPPEPQLICMTPAELLAHDEQVASEAVKRVQGELVDAEKLKTDSITLNFSPPKANEPIRQMMIRINHSGLMEMWETKPETVEEKRNLAIMAFNQEGFAVIEKAKLEEMQKKLGEFLA